MAVPALRGNASGLFDEDVGAYTSGIFCHLLEREVRRALRYQEFLAVLTLEVTDQSRRHPPPPSVQRLIVEHTQSELRCTDIVGRSGDRVAIALGCIPEEDARFVAERLRARVRAAVLPTDHFPVGQVVISIGGACFPKDGTDGRSLMDASLLAMGKAAQEPGGGVWIGA